MLGIWFRSMGDCLNVSDNGILAWDIYIQNADANCPKKHRRYYYRACIQKTGWTRFLPVDLFNNSEYTSLAKKYYELIFSNFAKYVSFFLSFCHTYPPIYLPPLYKPHKVLTRI